MALDVQVYDCQFSILIRPMIDDDKGGRHHGLCISIINFYQLRGNDKVAKQK